MERMGELKGNGDQISHFPFLTSLVVRM